MFTSLPPLHHTCMRVPQNRPEALYAEQTHRCHFARNIYTPFFSCHPCLCHLHTSASKNGRGYLYAHKRRIVNLNTEFASCSPVHAMLAPISRDVAPRACVEQTNATICNCGTRNAFETFSFSSGRPCQKNDCCCHDISEQLISGASGEVLHTTSLSNDNC